MQLISAVKLHCKLFGFKKFIKTMSNKNISIHHSCRIGSDFVFNPAGKILFAKNVALFGKSIIVADENPDAILEIGEGTKINYNFYLNYTGGCSIGANCAIASNVSITSSSLYYKNSAVFSQAENENRRVVIKDNCWIGTGAIILPGVTIVSGTIIAAGAVVNKSIDVSGVYGGVPAKKIKDL